MTECFAPAVDCCCPAAPVCVHGVPKGLGGGVLNVPEVSLPSFDDTASHRLQLCLARSELTRHCWASVGSVL